jgi:hypothetical protein
MASNTWLISSGVSTCVRMGRVARSASVFIAFCVSRTSSSAAFHSGFHSSIGRRSIQVANPSFSQMSSHHCMVTRSPNH